MIMNLMVFFLLSGAALDINANVLACINNINRARRFLTGIVEVYVEFSYVKQEIDDHNQKIKEANGIYPSGQLGACNIKNKKK